MASSTATVAKDKGDAAFKAGSFAEAVGHYTAAHVADPTNATIPLNRAAAYLRLQKFHDAERDTSTVLKLDPRNVKAFFRRAQARLALDRVSDAESDLRSALQIEPANESIKAQLADVQKRLVSTSKTKREPVDITTQSPTAGSLKRRTVRNVPIEIVDDDSPGDHEQGKSIPPAPRVGAAIFHRDGTQTVFRTPGDVKATATVTATAKPHAPSERQTSAPPLSPTPVHTTIPAPPQTHFQLTRTWASLPSASMRFAYLKTIPPANLPTLFKSSLESTFLASVLNTFQEVISLESPNNAPPTHDTLSTIQSYLMAFPSVPRFDTNVLFLGTKEKEIASHIWATIIGSGGNQGVPRLEEYRKRWGVAV